MICLLDVIALDVWNTPHVLGVFSERIAREIASLRSLEVSLAGVFCGYPHMI
ncbi:MAG: hypothetical protein DDT26_02738 [Dehalococcoidia bacterium]|nr:hypothetical protein [Chloroflexota bacterium]